MLRTTVQRTWDKCVSLEALIVSTWVLLTSVTIIAFVPANSQGASASDYSNTNNNNVGGGGAGSISNITLLDLYPELKEYLLKKALAQISPTTTEDNNLLFQPPQQQFQQQQQIPNVQAQPNTLWGSGGGYNNYNNDYDSVNALSNYMGSNYGNVPTNNAGENGVTGFGLLGGKYSSSRKDLDAESSDFYNYQKEVLKHFHPFGTPEFYDSWKFKPSPSSSSWGSGLPAWDEEPAEVEHIVGHEVTKDFSCLAGLLGLKTLKSLKIATIFKKLKLIGIAILAFKLGVLLSPIAIPLLFPIILIATTVKIIPLILIIVLLLKLLKKQIKIKKPFGKFLDQTSSLFFEDIDSVTEKVMRSSECVGKINCEIGKSSKAKERTNSRRLET